MSLCWGSRACSLEGGSICAGSRVRMKKGWTEVGGRKALLCGLVAVVSPTAGLHLSDELRVKLAAAHAFHHG